jgi:hypothetical protein
VVQEILVVQKAAVAEVKVVVVAAVAREAAAVEVIGQAQLATPRVEAEEIILQEASRTFHVL